jgi:hypothetical protein
MRLESEEIDLTPSSPRLSRGRHLQRGLYLHISIRALAPDIFPSISDLLSLY